MRFLLVSDDLMFQSQVRQASQAAGVELTVGANMDAVVHSLDSDDMLGVLVDLNTSNLDLESLSQQKSHPSLRRIAVGPHVHKDRLEAARSAGWQTYTRGQFHAHGPQILADQPVD